MAKDILKEAIADAKAVREVALANAKSALEEAFTPKLNQMLSAKLSEELEEDFDLDDLDDLELGERQTPRPKDKEHKDMDEMMYDEDMEMEGDTYEEEIDLEEVLNELEVEEGDEADDEEVVAEEKGDDDEEVDLEEIMQPDPKVDDVHKVNYSGDKDNVGYIHENDNFNLDALLKEINDLEDEELEETRVGHQTPRPTTKPGRHRANPNRSMFDKDGDGIIDFIDPDGGSGSGGDYVEEGCADVEEELEEIKSAFNTVKSELNEVNLLNSKLLYVNRIFKANTLDDAQKLRVVETLDKADSTKEAKLIYETIKDSFSIAKTKKVAKRTARKPIKEGFKGIASKASGVSRAKKTAPKRAIISESDNMVNRFQKLANIKINE